MINEKLDRLYESVMKESESGIWYDDVEEIVEEVGKKVNYSSSDKLWSDLNKILYSVRNQKGSRDMGLSNKEVQILKQAIKKYNISGIHSDALKESLSSGSVCKESYYMVEKNHAEKIKKEMAYLLNYMVSNLKKIYFKNLKVYDNINDLDFNISGLDSFFYFDSGYSDKIIDLMNNKHTDLFNAMTSRLSVNIMLRRYEEEYKGIKIIFNYNKGNEKIFENNISQKTDYEKSYNKDLNVLTTAKSFIKKTFDDLISKISLGFKKCDEYKKVFGESLSSGSVCKENIYSDYKLGSIVKYKGKNYEIVEFEDDSHSSATLAPERGGSKIRGVSLFNLKIVEESLSTESFKVGDRVKHQKFGGGVIKQIDDKTYSVPMIVVKLKSGDEIVRGENEFKKESLSVESVCKEGSGLKPIGTEKKGKLIIYKFKDTDGDYYSIVQDENNIFRALDKKFYTLNDATKYIRKQYNLESLSPLDSLYERVVCKEASVYIKPGDKSALTRGIGQVVDSGVSATNKISHIQALIADYHDIEDRTPKNQAYRSIGNKVQQQFRKDQHDVMAFRDIALYAVESLSTERVVCKEELKVDGKYIQKLKNNNIDFDMVGDELLVDESFDKVLDGLGIPYKEMFSRLDKLYESVMKEALDDIIWVVKYEDIGKSVLELYSNFDDAIHSAKAENTYPLKFKKNEVKAWIKKYYGEYKPRIFNRSSLVL